MNILPQMEQGEVCEYCGKQPLFVCAQCKWTSYCSKQHQVEHWRVHKEHCNIINSYRLRKEEEEVNKTRSQLRKKYLEHFMHKIYDSCIKIALEMVTLEQKHIKTTREIFNEMEYGISVCLLARSWLNVRNEAKAMIVIQSYLEEKMHFLKDMRDVISFETLHKQDKKALPLYQEETEILLKDRKQLSRSRKSSEKLMQVPVDIRDSGENHSKLQISSNLSSYHLIIKQFAIKKVSLIASVANILYTIKQPVIKMYEIYTQHIQKMFGRESHETSNCYFMMGSHFMQKNQYNKSIACFMRAAELRGNIAGDCYYNLGIIFHLLRKPQVALMMFENAAKLRENQFSENSSEVADVYHNLALINQSLGDFKSAIQNLEKIALIYSKDKNSDEYKNAKESIKTLEAAFRKHMEKSTNLSTNLMSDLKKTIRKASKMPDDAISQHSLMSDREIDKVDKTAGSNGYLKISDHFLSKLNSLEAYYLSELQIQLSKCESIYMAANTVGSSPFLRVLKRTQLEEVIKDNQTLFKNVSIEKLSKRGIKDNPQLD